MSTLSTLKTKAAAQMATIHADVTSYISALETKVTTSRLWIAGGTAIGVIVGFLGSHLHR